MLKLFDKLKQSKNKLIFTVSLAAGVILIISMFFWMYLDYTVSNPKNAFDNSSHLVVINQGDDLNKIATKLSDEGILRSKTAFLIYARFSPARGRLQAGTYNVAPNLSIKQIVSDMVNGRIAAIRVIIPEGLNLAEMAEVVAKSSFATKEQFQAALADEYSSKTIELKPAGTTSLEGLLAPGSYDMLINTSAHDLILEMLERFYKTRSDYIAKPNPQNLNFYQSLILASIVELEASNTEDRKLIAGVFYNRLKIGMKLQTDPTVNYVTGNKKTTSTDIANTNSPYNTYKINGLPPTLISSPSLDSLEAVFSPTPSNYLYFIGGKDGKVYYAETYAAHQENINRYLN